MTKVRTTPVAKSIPFDSSGPGNFSSTDVEAAIKEAKSDAINLPRYTIVTVFNGTVSNNDWLGYSNLLPGDATPIIVPEKAALKEVTFANGNSGVDGKINLYKNGTAAGNIFNTLIITNGKEASFIVEEVFQAGDTLRGRWEDDGTNPQDAAIVYFFQLQE